MRAPKIALVLGFATALASPGHAFAQDEPDPYAGITADAVPADGMDVEWGRAVTVVNGPIDRVLAIVHAYDRYHDLMPNFHTARVLSRRGDDALVYMEVGIARDTVTLWGQMRILSRQNQDHTRVVEATMLRGNMNQFRARWQLTPIDGGARTRVEFRILVDPRMPLPSAIFTEENVKAARRMIRALRERFVTA